MEKRKFGFPILLVMLLAVISLLVLAGCNPQTAEEPEQQPDYKLYWNVDKDAYSGDAKHRAAEADGSFSVRLFADGEIVTYKVADRAMVDQMDMYYLMGIAFDENGNVAEVLSVDALQVQLLSDEFYVQRVEGSTVYINSSYRFDGMEGVFTTTADTGIYDMTGVSGEPGTVAALQENDRIIAVGRDGIAEAVFVFGREGVNSRITRYCEQCQQEVSWANWYHEDSLPVASGHYYLVTDVQLTGQKSIAENETICLDLNGHTVTGKENARIYSLHYEGITLSIFDYSEAKTGKLVGRGETCPQGVCVWVRFGTFNLYGGTLDGSGATSNVNGVTVAVPKNAVMHMYGGTIIGGKTTYAISKTSGNATNSMGGSINVAGTFDIYDGTIRDGYASCYYDQMKGSYFQGYGGNVLVMGGSFTMHGGTIENGVAEGGGGNVYVSNKGTFCMKGGSLSGGQALKKGKNGGNLVIGSGCNFTFSGGTITGGVSRNYGGNVHMLGTMTMTGGSITGGSVLDINTGRSKDDQVAKNLFLVNGSMTMTGGRIGGYVAVTDSKAKDGKKPYLCLSGTAQITGAKQGHNNLQLNTANDGYSLDVKNLSKGAKIGVTASGKFTNQTGAGNMSYFASDIGGTISYVDGCLFEGRLGCLCGAGKGESHIGKCDGALLPWQSWASDKTLPTAEGYYYLLRDVQCGQNSVQAGAHVHLDLNGKTVTGKEVSRIYTTFHEDSHLTITDSGKTGRLVATGAGNVQGMGLWIRYGSATLYGGTLDASTATSTMSGVAVRVDKNTQFTMYGGRVLGGTALCNDKGAYGTGGSVQVMGVFNLHGGSVENGKSFSHGGNIAVDNGAQFHMSGGTVAGGKNLESGKSGGNIYIAGGGTMYLSGGTVCDGLTRNIGGNIYGAGKLSMSGGTITGGMRYKAAEDGTVTETYFPGGNVQLVSGQLCMSGGLIEGYVTITSYNDKPAGVTLSGSARIIGGNNHTDLSLVAQGSATEVPVVNIDGVLAQDAMIGLVNTGFFSGPTTQENADNFVVRGGLDINCYDGRLAAGILYHCVCGSAAETHKPGCNGEKKIWNAWVSETALPTADGYWYLTKNVTGCKQTGVQADSHVYLDLNGKTVTSNPGSRIYTTFHENSHLTITDSSAEQTGTLIATGESEDQGKVVWVRYGSVTLYGGTLDASQVHTTSNGAAVHVPGGSCFSMNGGSIISGSAALGGGIYSSGTVTITDGLIARGQGATDSTLIHITGKNAALTMTGGKVDGATLAGGGMQKSAITATDNAIVRLDGGTVLGKPCGMYLYNATLEMQSGTVGGAYIYVNGSASGGSIVNISGGTVEEGIYYYRGTGTISGAPVICGGFGLKLAEEKIFALGDLTDNAQILITCADAGRIIAEQLADVTDLKHLQSAQKDQSFSFIEGKGLYLSKGKFACSVCGGVYDGCEHSQLMEWTAVTDDLSVINQGGNYYLTKDITLTKQLTVAKDAKITLDLNGYTVSSSVRVLGLNNASQLTITDTVGTGRIKSTATAKDNGMVLNINNAGAVVTMYAGTLDGSEITNANNGAAVNVTGTFTLYGGTILGGQAVNGGALRIAGNGVMEMYGGLIYGGTASGLGDNIYLASAKTSTFAGGQIAGGVHFASGGLKLCGALVIDKALTAQLGEGLTAPTYSLRLSGAKKVDASQGLTQGAKIYITLSDTNDTVATNVADQTQAEYFYLDDTQCVRSYDPDTGTLRLIKAPQSEETV